MTFILNYQWEIFIILEVLSIVFLLLFLLIRYAFRKLTLSRLFLAAFISMIIFEGILALGVYRETGEIDTFQIVILVFIVYASTLGIADFKRLDRWIKQKVGNWQGVDLLTARDKQIIQQQKDPIYRARKYRKEWFIHTIIFVIAHVFFFMFYGNERLSFLEIMSDWSWLENFDPENIPPNGPYRIGPLYLVSLVWAIAYIGDTINALYYTIFKE